MRRIANIVLVSANVQTQLMSERCEEQGAGLLQMQEALELLLGMDAVMSMKISCYLL